MPREGAFGQVGQQQLQPEVEPVGWESAGVWGGGCDLAFLIRVKGCAVCPGWPQGQGQRIHVPRLATREVAETLQDPLCLLKGKRKGRREKD